MAQDMVQDADYINRPEVIILIARFQRQIANGGIGSRKEGATKWKDRWRLSAAATFIIAIRPVIISATPVIIAPSLCKPNPKITILTKPLHRVLYAMEVRMIGI